MKDKTMSDGRPLSPGVKTLVIVISAVGAWVLLWGIVGAIIGIASTIWSWL
jgi:hypothetical protein